MNMKNENINEDLFVFQDEEFDEEIQSRMNVTDISSGGSNREESNSKMQS